MERKIKAENDRVSVSKSVSSPQQEKRENFWLKYHGRTCNTNFPTCAVNRVSQLQYM